METHPGMLRATGCFSLCKVSSRLWRHTIPHPGQSCSARIPDQRFCQKVGVISRWNAVEYARNIWEICKNGPSFVSKSSSISGKTDVFRNFLVCKKTGGQEAVSSSLATRTSKIPETARFRGFFVLFSMKFRVSPSSRSESCKIFKNVQRSLLRSIMRRRGRCVSLPEKEERCSRCEVNSVAISFALCDKISFQ